MKSFKLIASTPKGNAYENEVLQISLMGSEGSLSVMAGHIPFITFVKAGELKIISTEEEELYADVGEGMLTVTKENVTLLLGSFELK